MIVDRTVQQ